MNRVDPLGLTDRGWPINGPITNDSAGTVYGYDCDYDAFIPVPTDLASSNSRDIDFVEVNGEWYKVGPWDF